MKTTESEKTHGSVKKTTNSNLVYKTDEELLTKNPKNTTQIESIAIEDTPFHAIRFEEKWFLTLGKYRLSEPMETKEQVLEDAKDASWIRIMQIMRIMIQEEGKDQRTEMGKDVAEMLNRYNIKPKKNNNKTIN